jgi:hypothetical protein
MSTTLFETFVDEVQLFTESVPRATIMHFVRKGCITLCRETRVWKESGSETLVAGEDDVCLDNWINDPGTSEREMIGIEELRYEGKPLTHKTEKQMLDLSDRFGSICAYIQPSLMNITLLNVPDDFVENDDFVDYMVSLAPSQTATGMDSDLLARYHEGIVAGAVGMLFAMPKKTWSNPTFANQYLGQFSQTVARALTDANQEFSRRVPRVVKYGGI